MKFINHKSVVWAYDGEIVTIGEKRMIMEFYPYKNTYKSKKLYIKAFYIPDIDERIN